MGSTDGTGLGTRADGIGHAAPAGYGTVTPWVISSDTARLIDFVQQAFGAHELARVPGPDGRVGHAEVRIGDAVVIMSTALAGGPRPRGSCACTSRTPTWSTSGRWPPGPSPSPRSPACSSGTGWAGSGTRWATSGGSRPARGRRPGRAGPPPAGPRGHGRAALRGDVPGRGHARAELSPFPGQNSAFSASISRACSRRRALVQADPGCGPVPTARPRPGCWRSRP